MGETVHLLNNPAVSERPLSDWARHAVAVVVEVVGSDLLANKLRELGVIPGAQLRVLHAGANLIIQIDEGRFAIRRRDAAAIRVSSPPAVSQARLAGQPAPAQA